MSAPRIVKCPHCARPVEWTPTARWRPFCSERCKMIDLGAWASESYRIPIEPETSPDAGSSDLLPDDFRHYPTDRRD